MKGSGKRRYAYRREATPRGRERMRAGELEPFDLEMYANLNTGVLEEYMDARNRERAFTTSAWSWPRVSVGVLVGALFALVNVFVGLKVGLLVYGAWYVTYLVGVGRAWRPGVLNVATGAANGAAFIATGLVYVFPAVFLVSALNPERVTPLVPAHALPPVGLVLAAVVLAGVLGTVGFIAVRRVWLVEDPLPYPGFDGFLKLLDMAHDVSAGAVERARHAVRLVASFAGVSALFAFVRDVPLVKGESVISRALGGSAWWSGDGVTLPASLAKFTHVGFVVSPLVVATGWFLRARAALVVGAGALFVWGVAVPLAVWFNVPVLVPDAGGDVGLRALADAGRPAALLAFAGPVRALAAGALVGAGLTALFRRAPTLRGALQARGRARDAYVDGRGWYEWPRAHVLVTIAVALVALPFVFRAGGFPVGASVVFTLVLVAATVLLGAVAARVLGESGIEPVIGASFIVFLVLFAAFTVLSVPVAFTVAMSLLGASVFASAISMTGSILLDLKNGLYVGTTPASQVKAQVTGLVPGAVVGVLAATVLAMALAQGRVDLAAPHAHAFATLVDAVVGGHLNYTLLALGVVIGVAAEAATGAGTAFGIGMFLPVGLVLPLVLGGVARDAWERRWLDARAVNEAWNEEKKTIKLLDSFMIATGLIVGEALLGTVLAVWYATGLLA